MARILYIAMSCGPECGSEDAIGWNLPLAMSRRGNEVFVLTRADKQEEIEAYLVEHPYDRGPEYLYEAQTSLELKMNGPFLSTKATLWCKRVSKKLPSIVQTYRIEVIHQITPVEFRSVIDADIKGVAMFLGPIGGAETVLPTLASYLKNERLSETLRLLINFCAVRKLKRLGTLNRFNVVWCANHETRDYLMRSGVDSSQFEILTEIGVSDFRLENAENDVCMQGSSLRRSHGKRLRLAYVGRLVPRKGVAALLDACSILQSKGVSFELGIYGDGAQRKALEEKASELNLTGVEFYGKVPHSQIEEAYLNSDALVMPSIRETTGTVLAEAVTYGKPVIAFDAFGAHVVLFGYPSVLVKPKLGVIGLASGIEAIAHVNISEGGGSLSDLASSLSWDRKALYFESRYLEEIKD